MSLNTTPRANRYHIGIFGRQNVGKSSLINALTNQDSAIVSDIKGTTTDPVFKAMELAPLGPVVLIDTPGIDDETPLGQKRMEKTYQSLDKTDIALFVVEHGTRLNNSEINLLDTIKQREIPLVLVINKSDLGFNECFDLPDVKHIYVSSQNGENIEKLKQMLGQFATQMPKQQSLIADIVSPCDTIVMVMPIDKGAPKGRIILPQQQVLREALDIGAVAIAVQPQQLKQTLKNLKHPPAIVITDSQVFKIVDKITPLDIPLTSFSIIFARKKGILKQSLQGLACIKNLDSSDTVLISEGCTHHRQCEDIGTVKIPGWLKQYTGKDVKFDFSSGNEFPRNLEKYSAIIHCGGCTLNDKEMKNRMEIAKQNNVPMTNYGLFISMVQGSLNRSILPFKEFENIVV